MILERFMRRLRAEPTPTLVDDGTLTVVGACFDPARADSAVVEEMRAAGVPVDTGPFVMRHVVTLPNASAVAEAVRILAPDGWTVDVVGPDRDVVLEPDAAAGGIGVRVWRQQAITGLEPARERTRMAGLAQRLGGDALGYEVLART